MRKLSILPLSVLLISVGIPAVPVAHASQKPAPSALEFQMEESISSFTVDGIQYTASSDILNRSAEVSWTDGLSIASARMQFNEEGDNVLLSLSFDNISGSQNFRFVHHSPVVGIEPDEPEIGFQAAASLLQSSNLGQSIQDLRHSTNEELKGKVLAVTILSSKICSLSPSQSLDALALRDLLECARNNSTMAGGGILAVILIGAAAIAIVPPGVGCGIGCGGGASCTACCLAEALCDSDGLPR